MRGSSNRQSYLQRRRKGKAYVCHCCNQEVPFCWMCRCGFEICQECMKENFWGMSCNGITWQCPDCGAQNGLGNQ
ncbi:MAG: hypothetical protein COS92_07180 [Desulfobacterales bacterium CG07_land_8_20_14_0_80_52_14]|nr:MAG: hypothetical protein COS92_07180 [Desulfobacterales bacterium CG07_land_8_20_14_0_80_52_14]